MPANGKAKSNNNQPRLSTRRLECSGLTFCQLEVIFSTINSMFLLFLFCFATSVFGFTNLPTEENNLLEVETFQDNESDIGEKLILTPYIEAGKIEQAKSLAKVEPLKGMVKSYSGFLTVDKKCDSNMFFWFFPSENNDTNVPVILWLQGGPGGSSLYGLFQENGPFFLKPSNKINLRQYSWTQVASCLYIDNPVGTGYSYTSSDECYSKNEVQVGQNLLSAVKQIMKLFPQYASNPFFVTGESYAGKYVPALSYAIHKDKDKKINLKGLAIGNGLVDPVNQLYYSDYLYQLGLLDLNGKNYFKKEEDRCRLLINNKKWKDAFVCFDLLLNGDTISVPTYFKNVTGFDHYFNFLHAKPPPEGNLTKFITLDRIRKSIHVGNATWNDGSKVEFHLKEDVMQSVRPWLEELLEKYKVLIYNGQLDIIVAYPLTEAYLQKLNWTAAKDYKTANRQIWTVDKEVAGYAKTAGNLIEVLVRNAGHMVPLDQPKWSLDLISRFIFGKKFN